MKRSAFITGLLFALAPLALGQLFPERRTVIVAAQPSAALADVDRDGTPDALVTDRANHRVLVLRGDPAGGFHPLATQPVGVTPVSIVAADFDGDGDPDAATANDTTGTITVLIGDGAGGFAPSPSFPCGANPRALVAADLDGDGDVDLAVVNYGVGTLGIHRGNGDGTFTAPLFLGSGGHSPTALLADDLDQDGDVDLVASDEFAQTVAVRLGSIGGGFGAPATFDCGPNPAALAAGDFDEDGIRDLFVANRSFSAGAIRWLRGTGGGGFAPPVAFPVATAPVTLAVARLDPDAHLDVVVGGSIEPGAVVLHGDGAGGVASSGSLVVPKGPRAVLPTDMQGDGRTDLVLVCDDGASFAPNQAIATLVANDGGTLESPRLSASEPDAQSLAMGDFDGDGALDVVTARYSKHMLTWAFGDGGGGFAVASSIPVDSFPNSVALGDLDNDGDLDAVTANNGVSAKSLSVSFGLGSGAFVPGLTLPAGGSPRDAHVADLDGDGRLDLAYVDNGGAGPFPGRIGFMKGIATGFAPPSFSATSAFTFDLALGDLNGDSRLDAIATNPGADGFTRLFGDGAGGFNSPQQFQIADDVWSAAIGDVDGDGLADVAVCAQKLTTAIDGVVAIYHGTAGGALGAPVSHSTGEAPNAIAIADVDADGDADVATPDYLGSLSVLRGNGAGGLLSVESFASVQFPYGLVVADADADGRLDLVTVGGKDSTVSDVAFSRNLGDCGFQVSYGSGCAGAGGFVPSLATDGCPKPGGALTLTVSQGAGGATGALLFGLGEGSVPMKPGCSLLVQPLLPLMIPFALSGSGPGLGGFALSSPIPAAFPAPVEFTVQALIADPVKGVAASNGARVRIQ